MMGFGLVFTIVVIGAIAYAMGWRPNAGPSKPASKDQTPLEQLQARYARGEISREQFEQMKRDLAT